VISFRYLVVTIVAIFLALGLGVLAGTTALDQTLVHNLRDRTSIAERKSNQSQRQLDDIGAFLDQLVPRVIGERLARRDVVLLVDDGADDGAVTTARTYLGDAGATIVAQLTVTNRMDPRNAANDGLARLLEVSGVTPSTDLDAIAARRLADRLDSGPAPPNTSGPVADLLRGLLDGGFLLPQGAPNLAEVGGAGQAVVVVAGGQGDPAAPFESFLVPFVEQLLFDDVPVAAGQPRRHNQSFVRILRGDPEVGAYPGLVTVDNLATDQPFGGVALVLGLKDRLETGLGGEYGEHAPNLIPELPQP
jgi:hypothetical protein